MTELIAAAAADNPGLPVLRTTLARSYCDLGRDKEAAAVIDDDISKGFGQFRYDAAWISSMTTLSEICIHLERADGAALLYDWLRSWDAQVSNSGVTLQGPIAFHAGCLVTLLGRFDQADGHFTQALKVGQKLDAPYWIATRIAWAQLDRKARSPNAGRAETMLADSASLRQTPRVRRARRRDRSRSGQRTSPKPIAATFGTGTVGSQGRRANARTVAASRYNVDHHPDEQKVKNHHARAHPILWCSRPRSGALVPRNPYQDVHRPWRRRPSYRSLAVDRQTAGHPRRPSRAASAR